MQELSRFSNLHAAGLHYICKLRKRKKKHFMILSLLLLISDSEYTVNFIRGKKNPLFSGVFVLFLLCKLKGATEIGKSATGRF